MIGAIMKRSHLKTMTTDELWTLHQEIAMTLSQKIIAEKDVLENRLRQLKKPDHLEQASEKRTRRPYPTVFPKYRNLEDPSETWSGRGKQPRWLAAQLRLGKQIEDFRIEPRDDASNKVNHLKPRLASAR